MYCPKLPNMEKSKQTNNNNNNNNTTANNKIYQADRQRDMKPVSQSVYSTIFRYLNLVTSLILCFEPCHVYFSSLSGIKLFVLLFYFYFFFYFQSI